MIQKLMILGHHGVPELTRVSMAVSTRKQMRFLFYVLTTLVFVLYYLPYIWLGQDAYYNAFDNLDSYVVWYRSVIQQGYAWAPSYTIIQSFLGGVPKFTLVAPFSLYYLLNIVLPTFHALNLMMILASLSGFWGMWLLSRNIFDLDRPSSAFLSLSFALTPFLPAWGMSISGQPLLLYAILKIRNNEASAFHWGIIALFPFVSNFQSAGVFIIASLCIWMVYDYYRKKAILPLFLISLTLLVIYSVIKISLLENLVAGEGFVSHRTEMTHYSRSAYKVFRNFGGFFLFGNVNVSLSLHTFVILPFVIATFFFFWIKNRKPDRRLSFLLSVIVVICLYVSILHLSPVANLRNRILLLKMFSMDRFYIFLQLLWHLCAAQSLVLLRTASFRKAIVSIMLAGQLLVCFAYQPTYYVYLSQFGFTIEPYHSIRRYGEYYAVDDFAKIKRLIGKPLSTYRVGSIGIPPAVAQYNGFYTIDGYSSNYPLAYKHRFKKIIDPELEKNEGNKKFFQDWGNQCVIMYDSDGQPFNTQVTKSGIPPFRDIRLHGEALADLDCDYIFSAENILHPELSNLKQIGRIESPLWNIIVYKLTGIRGARDSVAFDHIIHRKAI